MNFLNKIPEKDLWTYLASSKKTIIMYGMGNGADKILDVCERYGIAISDFFASDGFVRGHSFHGKTVLSYSQIKEKYGTENIIVLLSFGSSLPEVLSLFRKINDECEMYAPDVPVCGSSLFTLDFFNEHVSDILKVHQMLSDDLSKKIYENVILYKISGKLEYLFGAESDKNETYTLLKANSFSVCADLGAYNGDTVRELLKECQNVQKIYAFEPDKRNFKKLQMFCSDFSGSQQLIPINAAAWNEDILVSFADEGNRNSGIFAPLMTAKAVDIQARKLDSVILEDKVDYIKYDVEGAEKEALLGSSRLIKTYSPALLVSAYHRSEDIFSLPLLVNAINSSYKLYYRRYPYIPAWDMNLICI